MTSPCGCTGFLHSTACSDQNVLDPFGAIRDAEQRELARGMMHVHLKDLHYSYNQLEQWFSSKRLFELIEDVRKLVRPRG